MHARVLAPLLLALLLAPALPAVADGPAPEGGCPSYACVDAIHADATCKRAEDGSRWGFVHPYGYAHVVAEIGAAGVRSPTNFPFHYDFFLGDSIGSSHRAWNWPGPVDKWWVSQDTSQGWLLPTDASYRITYRVDAWIHVSWPADPLGWSDAKTRQVTVQCV